MRIYECLVRTLNNHASFFVLIHICGKNIDFLARIQNLKLYHPQGVLVKPLQTYMIFLPKTDIHMKFGLIWFNPL